MKATPSQTVGPFFHLGFDRLMKGNFVAANAGGDVITVKGCVLDGDQKPVPDAALEFWQADTEGKYLSSEDGAGKSSITGFHGFTRIATDTNGRFQFATVKPGRVSDEQGILHAPHIVVIIFMRGLLKQLVTRIYFPDQAANVDDPILNLIPPARRSTLIAKTSLPKTGEGHEDILEWNVILQGTEETVFFEW